MKKALLLITALFLTTMVSQAQTTIKVVNSGCFVTTVEEITIGEDNKMTLTTDLASVKKKFRNRTSIASKTTFSLISDLTKEVQSVKSMGLCTSTKMITITIDGITKTYKSDGCGMAPRVDNLLKELFAYQDDHFVKSTRLAEDG